MTKEKQLLPIEEIKAVSRSLRGTIAEELHSAQPGFSSDNVQLLKFHGVIQHDDRDLRLKRRREGQDSQFDFTARVRSTGGKMTALQMLGLLDLIDELRLGPLRITSRQGVQLGPFGKGYLKRVIRRITDLGLTTFSSGGDVNCNVMCCPSSSCHDSAQQQLHSLAEQIAATLMPDAGAYEDVWLSGRTTQPGGAAAKGVATDKLYGKAYLPHKLKISVAFPEDNCVDVYAQDIGLLAVRKGDDMDGSNMNGDHIEGYEMLVGGGLGMIPSAPSSFRALAQPMAFVRPEDVQAAVCAVMAVYRDFGNRTCRGKARLKYLIHRWGLDEFRRQVELKLGRTLDPPRGIRVSGHEDHLGWHCQGEDQWALGILVESGRLDNADHGRMAQALREILVRFRPDVHLTPRQNLLLSGVNESSRCDIDAILHDYEVRSADELSGVRRRAMACPSLPRCNNAITEAERIVPEVLAKLEAEMEKLGLAGESCGICVTGCSSGCVRCYLADIALVGRTVDGRRSVDKFAIYVGGGHLGDQLNQLYKDLVPMPQIVPSIRPLLVYFKQDRLGDETLGQFFNRKGVKDLQECELAASKRP